MANKRSEKVTDRIYEATCTLLLDDNKDYSEISIKDIIEKAGVCRNSFNRNYLTKDDIFIKKFNEIYVPDKKESNASEKKTINLKQLIWYIFWSARENKRFFLAFYKANAQKYYEMISKHIIASNTAMDIKNLPKEDYYKYACRAWLCIGLLTEWLHRDCDATIEEMADTLLGFELK